MSDSEMEANNSNKECKNKHCSSNFVYCLDKIMDTLSFIINYSKFLKFLSSLNSLKRL